MVLSFSPKSLGMVIRTGNHNNYFKEVSSYICWKLWLHINMDLFEGAKPVVEVVVQKVNGDFMEIHGTERSIK